MIMTLTGASGSGKTTIARGLFKCLPLFSQLIPSYTTRKPRDTDLPGEYKYLSKIKFRFLKRTGAFLWAVHVHGNSYGTTKRWVRKALRDENTVYVMILVPETIKTLRDFAEAKGLLGQVYNFYVYSPHREVLRKRLEKRGDSAEEVTKRLADCLRWDQDAVRSCIPYEFVRNDREIDETVAETKNRFLVRFETSESLF